MLAAALLMLAGQAHAQRQPTSATVPANATRLVAGVPDSAVLAELRFRSIGPAVMSGRVSDIAVPSASRPGDRLGKIMYIAAAAGGVWKTTNGGATWSPLFDAQRVSSIGAVAVAPTDGNILWVGSGESNNLRSSSWGDGIYKSTDGGKTWTHMGLRKSQHIARVLIHPTNADIVYVAAMGPLWAGGGERGLFKTTDGGRTWKNLKQLGEYTGFTDVTFDPTNPDIVYAASYQRDRRAYSFVAGGPESGIWKSTDGGDNWTQLTAGLPTGDKGRIGISVSRSMPHRIYATVHAEDGGIFRSDDAGATWTRTSTLTSIPWFFGQIRADPNIPDRVYFLGVQLMVSDDAGRTFRAIANNTHADHHAMWIDPNDSDHLVIGNDGGLYMSEDKGATWDFAVNLPISTFYAINVDQREPYYWVYGGLQDNGTWGAPVQTRTRTGVTNMDWLRAGGGDGFYPAIDPTDHNIVYLESQNGALSRFDYATQESKPIRPSADGERLRYNWSAPLLISPHANTTLYFAAHYVFRSTDRGDSWTKVSPDLTRGLDRETLPIMGFTGPGGLGRHDGTADFGNIATLSESPRVKGLLYTGSDDGVVAVTRDGGANWTKIEKFPGVPDLTHVSRVVASAHHDGTVYATFDGHRSNDFKPYVLKSTDYGRTWTSIAANLPADGPAYVIREHHRNPNLLFVGTEYGVFASVNGGKSWSQIKAGIAPAPVHDLLIHPRENDLVVGTHGRGMYVLDDISPLEKLAEESANIRLFAIRPVHIENRSGGFDIPGDRWYTTENPPAGAIISYLVGSEVRATSTFKLRILDAREQLVRELEADNGVGIQRTNWDLRYAPAIPAEGNRGGFGQQQSGPYVYPGRYTVQLQVDDRIAAQTTVEVQRDPLVRLAEAEYRDLHSERMRAYELQRSAQQLLDRIDAARRRIASSVEGKDTATAAVRDARALSAELEAVQVEVRGRRPAQGQGGFGGGSGNTILGRINGVASAIATRHFPPTPEHRATLNDATTALNTVTQKADGLLTRADRIVRGL